MLFHDSTGEYIHTENGEVIVRAKVKDCEQVWLLVCNDLQKRKADNVAAYPMHIAGAVASARIKACDAFKYQFKAVDASGEEKYYGAGEWLNEYDYDNNFLFLADFDTPDWSKGCVWYQIMPDSFYNGDILRDKTGTRFVSQNSWGNSHFGKHDFFGGDLCGIAEKLDYIQELGANVISINPIWSSNHQAGYGCEHLTQVDYALGGNDALIALCEQVHARGMKIVLDVVFDYANNECQWYNLTGERPLAGGIDKGDRYYDYILRDEKGYPVPSFFDAPLVDFSQQKVRDEIYLAEDSILKTYLKPPYNVDGYRIDVANIFEGSDPDSFGSCYDVIKQLRREMKKISPDKLLILENDTKKMYTYGVFDSKWNYSLYLPMEKWMKDEIGNEEFFREVYGAMRKLPRPMADSLYNCVSNHDKTRVLNNCKSLQSAIATILFDYMFVGSPTIFAGDENGTVDDVYPGMPSIAPTSFSAIRWVESAYDGRIRGLYRSLIAVRQAHGEVFKNGAMRLMGPIGERIVFERRAADDVAVVVIHKQDKPQQVEIDGEDLPDALTDALYGVTYRKQNGKFRLCVESGGSVFVPHADVTNIGGLNCRNVTYANGTYTLHKDGQIETELFHDDTWIACVQGDGEAQVSVAGRAYPLACGELRIERDACGARVWLPSGKVHIGCENLGAYVPVRIFNPSGELQLQIRTEKGKGIYARDFTDGKGCLFPIEKIGNFAKADGLRPEGRLLSESLPYGDYTLEFCAENSAGTAMGVTDGRNALMAECRGKTLAAYLQTSEWIQLGECPFTEEKAVIRFEKTGAEWRVYAVNGQESVLLATANCNFSAVRACLAGDGKGRFLYVKRGDGKDRCAYTPMGEVDISGKLYAQGENDPRLIITKGKFTYCYGGMENDGLAPFAIVCRDVPQRYKCGFAVTLEEFAQNGQITVTLPDKTVRIANGAIAVGKQKIAYSFALGKEYSFFAQNYGGVGFLTLNGKLLATWKEPAKTDRIELCGKGVRFVLGATLINSLGTPWLLGKGDNLFWKEGLDLSCHRNTYAYAWTSVGVNDFVFAANVKLYESEFAKRAYFSVNMGNGHGKHPEKGGVSLRFFRSGKTELVKENEVLAEGKIDNIDPESFYVLIVKNGGRITLYAASNERETELVRVLDTDTGYTDGGALCFYCEKVRTFLCGAKLYSVSAPNAEEYAKNTKVRIDESKHRYVLGCE